MLKLSYERREQASQPASKRREPRCSKQRGHQVQRPEGGKSCVCEETKGGDHAQSLAGWWHPLATSDRGEVSMRSFGGAASVLRHLRPPFSNLSVLFWGSGPTDMWEIPLSCWCFWRISAFTWSCSGLFSAFTQIVDPALLSQWGGDTVHQS